MPTKSSKAKAKNAVKAKKASSKKAAAKKVASRKVAVKKAASKRTTLTKADAQKAIAAKTAKQRKALLVQLTKPTAPKDFTNPTPIKLTDLTKKISDLNIRPTVSLQKLLLSLNKINPNAAVPFNKLPEDVVASIQSLRTGVKRFHGAKVNLGWFPFPLVFSPCSDKFGYMSSLAVRTASKLPFNVVTQGLLNQLGNMMGDPGRDSPADSTIPSGYTYFGQFVDHDITMDVSSTLDVETDANTVNNMRTPALDLDSLYGRGPALDPYRYVFPTTGPSTAIKFVLGTNQNAGLGGPGGSAGAGGMQVQTDFDVPRINNPLSPGASSHTAVIGDPRNDENLIVSQFHHAMLKFHNQVVDMLVLVSFSGDIFIEAKKIVTHHYQWAVVKDYLTRICGTTAVNNALAGVTAAVGSAFQMPVEFAVAAYRFGHSMVRDHYWLSFAQIFASMEQVFQFNRNPNLPVLSNWAVDFNAFFTTGVTVPVNNRAKKIDSVLTNALENLPGFSGMMAILATRNLRRGLALGLPSGQAMATSFGIAPMTAVQLKQGLPAAETAILDSNAGLLLTKTPLWYYVLREAAVLGGGNSLGPVGAKIVADTFVRMLKRDAQSYLNVSGGFTPFLPSVTAGNFTVADLVIFAGVTQP